jgi:hypothetical protein
LTGTGAGTFDILTTTNLTLTAHTSTLEFTGGGGTWGFRTGGASFNWYDIVINGNGTFGFGQTANCRNLTWNSGAISTNKLSLVAPLNMTGTLTLYGNSRTLPLTLNSSVAGTARVVTISGTIDLQNLVIKDITAAGSASPFVQGLKYWSNTGNNSNITFAEYLLNNYQSFKVGDGMSVSEKIR